MKGKEEKIRFIQPRSGDTLVAEKEGSFFTKPRRGDTGEQEQKAEVCDARDDEMS